MKNIKIMIAVTCLFSLNLFAQNVYNRNNTMANPNQNQSQNFEPSKEEIEKNREESMNKLMNKLTSDLALDELQVIAIRQIYNENIKKQGIILKKEESNESKSEALKSLAESTEARVIALLNPQQKEKYNLIKNDVESGKNMKKDKAKEKGKKKRKEQKD